MGHPIYVLDSNVFIEAYRRYYAFDIAPKFWESLIHFANIGIIESIDRVKLELEKGKIKPDGTTDDLAAWAENNFKNAFQNTSGADVIRAYSRIIAWVTNNSQFTNAAKLEFANESDGWLIAYALAKNRIIVTHEVLKSDVKNKVPIPNVCLPFKIRYIDTFVMLREIGVHFS